MRRPPMSEPPLRITRRGWAVVFATAGLAAATIGYLTANWCWYGYCGP